jgi:glycosyltransferase involved in cell wall biosynthesis
MRRQREEIARLVHVASLNPVKDQTTLLHALGQLADRGRDFRLDVVGEDTLGGRIQALTVELGLTGRVRFHGFLTHRELRPIVEAAHLAVVSSRHEAGPVVALEAAAVGVPTVGTCVGHISEWNEAAALAVPCQNSAALADALELVLDDEDLRIRLANEALRRAKVADANATSRGFGEIYRRFAERS